MQSLCINVYANCRFLYLHLSGPEPQGGSQSHKSPIPKVVKKSTPTILKTRLQGTIRFWYIKTRFSRISLVATTGQCHSHAELSRDIQHILHKKTW